MHKKKKVENLLEEKLFFERRGSGPLRDGKNIVQLMIQTQKYRTNFILHVLKLCSFAIMHFYLQIKKDKALCCSVGVSYSSTSHVSKGLSNLT